MNSFLALQVREYLYSDQYVTLTKLVYYLLSLLFSVFFFYLLCASFYIITYIHFCFVPTLQNSRRLTGNWREVAVCTPSFKMLLAMKPFVDTFADFSLYCGGNFMFSHVFVLCSSKDISPDVLQCVCVSVMLCFSSSLPLDC